MHFPKPLEYSPDDVESGDRVQLVTNNPHLPRYEGVVVDVGRRGFVMRWDGDATNHYIEFSAVQPITGAAVIPPIVEPIGEGGSDVHEASERPTDAPKEEPTKPLWPWQRP